MILEITPWETNGFFLSVDDDRRIVFEKEEKDIDLKRFFKFLKAPVRSVAQKSWEGKPLTKARRRVIVAAHPALATTIPIPLILPREHSGRTKEKITFIEVENLISRALQKIFNGSRKEASRRLGVDDLHTILVSAKAKHFRVDGKEVADPAGFGGKKISLLLELTFTNRELFRDLRQFFNAPEDFFFAEAPQVHLLALSRIRKLPLNLIVADEDGTSLFVLEKGDGEHPVLYREKLDWLFSSFFKKIRETLAVSEAAARHLYRTYRAGEMSEGAARAFKKALQPVLDDFWRKVKDANLKGTVYLDVAHPLPFDLPHRLSGAAFEEHPIVGILGKLGFSTDLAGLGEKGNAAIRTLLYLLEAYLDKSNSGINKKLHRRLHWLVV